MKRYARQIGRLVIVFVPFLAALVFVLYYSFAYSQAESTSARAAPLVTAGVAVIAAVIALIREPIYRFLSAPTLVIEFLPSDRRDCHSTVITEKDSRRELSPAHYFRVRVKNDGWRTAENVEVSIEEIKRFRDGKYHTDMDFMPLRLPWSYWREHRTELSIPSGTYRHCDFGFILHRTIDLWPGMLLRAKENDHFLFWLDVLVRPNAGRTSLLPGKYMISLIAFGTNAKQASINIGLEWTGKWRDNIDELLRDELKIQI